MTRETAIYLLNNLRAFAEEDDEPAIDMAIEALSAEKTGEWIEHDPNCEGLAKVYECPRCGEEVNGEPTNYCPNCGADMRGEEE